MIDKVNYFFDDLEERQEIWELLKQRDDILVSTSLYNNLEINGPGASKGEGLLQPCFHTWNQTGGDHGFWRW